jgi:butyryl-CoA dehydrogenase
MFVMMNAARFSVGVQGMAIADRAYQSAVEYAKERVQFRDVASRDPKPVAIIGHPDVRRMLLWCKANIEAMRALAYVTAASLDYAHKSPDEAVRKEHQAFVDLMIPIVKGWLTERSIDVASTALQVFGGMGYVEETGVAQQYRDVRITTIYEGTTGIQALDLIGRKLVRDMGAGATKILKQIGRTAKELEASEHADVRALAAPLAEANKQLAETAQWLGMNAMGDLSKVFANSVPFLNFFGTVAGGWQLFRGAKIAAEKIAAGDSDPFYAAKIVTATFYAHNVLSQAAWYHKQIVEGSGDVMAGGADLFDVERRALATA